MLRDGAEVLAPALHLQDATVEAACRAYAADVRAGRFSGPKHCYPMDRP